MAREIMKPLKLAYPLPVQPPREAWVFIATLNAARRLDAPPTRRTKGRWFLRLHPDDYSRALLYLQVLSIELGLPPYHPEPPALDNLDK